MVRQVRVRNGTAQRAQRRPRGLTQARTRRVTQASIRRWRHRAVGARRPVRAYYEYCSTSYMYCRRGPTFQYIHTYTSTTTFTITIQTKG